MILTISNAEYHARPEVSNTGLKLLAKSPAHFKAGFSGISDDTARIGTASHAMVLEGGKDLVSITANRKRHSNEDRKWWSDYFKGEFGVEIDTSASVKEWYPEFQRKTGKTIVSVDEKRMLDAMYQSYLSNQKAVDLLQDTEPEISIFQTLNGVDCKSRLDAHNPTRIVDLKTCEDASEHAFASNCAKFGYHRQDAMYSMMHYKEYDTWPEFHFIVQEKSPPYSCVVYTLDDDAKQNGLWLVERDLDVYKRCVASDMWPSLPNVSDLRIPIYERETFEIITEQGVVSV